MKRYNLFPRDLIIAGRARPSFIVSHRLPLTSAPEAYRKFDERVEGYTKVAVIITLLSPATSLELPARVALVHPQPVLKPIRVRAAGPRGASATGAGFVENRSYQLFPKPPGVR